MSIFNRFVKDESGATMIEYALIAALIAVVSITVLTSLGTNVQETFRKVRNEVD